MTVLNLRERIFKRTVFYILMCFGSTRKTGPCALPAPSIAASRKIPVWWKKTRKSITSHIVQYATAGGTVQLNVYQIRLKQTMNSPFTQSLSNLSLSNPSISYLSIVRPFVSTPWLINKMKHKAYCTSVLCNY